MHATDHSAAPAEPLEPTVTPAEKAAPAAAPTRADRHVLIAGHVLFAVLLAIGVVRVVAAGPLDAAGTIACLVIAALTAAWYVVGAVWVAGAESIPITAEIRPPASRAGSASRTAHGPASTLLRARVWLAGLIVLWLILVVFSSEFIWLAFLIAMLVWHLLPIRAAAVIDIAVAVVTVVAFAWHQGEVVVGAVIGPTVGIASAAVMTEIYQRLRVQSEERRRLLDELVRTQQALAAHEHEAGRLAERERLARDIHDTVGQSLASVILLLRAALGDTDAGPRGEAHRTQLQTALDSTLAALAETRRLVRGLAPESIEKRGLVRALSSLADENRALGTRTTFTEHCSSNPIPIAAEVALLRVAQEAVANARNHAEAHSVTITLTHQGDEVSVDVVDDGVGFDPAARTGRRADGSGFGLQAMRSRIRECGGEVVVESEPGSGTAIRATIPITTGPLSGRTEPDAAAGPADPETPSHNAEPNRPAESDDRAGLSRNGSAS